MSSTEPVELQPAAAVELQRLRRVAAAPRRPRPRWLWPLGIGTAALAILLVALVLTRPSIRQYANVFTPTGELVLPRINGQAAFVGDGSVLVFGGHLAEISPNSRDPSRWAEVWDPVSGRFQVTGPMVSPRSAAMNTARLNDGRLLILGGVLSQRELVREAEIFEPGRNRFVAAPPMVHPRTYPEIAVLRDGRVLVIGGEDDDGPVLEAELFDPVANRFMPLGAMFVPRSYARPVVLGDGRVLLIGGYAGERLLDGSHVELFEPRTLLFQPAGAMANARAGDLAAHPLRDGRLLVIGGVLRADSGEYDRRATDAEIFDPRTNEFSAAGPGVPYRDDGVLVSLADGRMLFPGTIDTELRSVSPVELYDPATGLVTAAGPMVTPRSGATWVTLQDGRLLVLGGWDGDGSLIHNAELFDPRTATFLLASPMAPRAEPVAIMLPDGRVFIYGREATGVSSVWGAEVFS